MERLNMFILDISKMRCPNHGRCNIVYTIFYSGESSNHHRNGVAFIVSKQLERCIESVCYISDKVIMIQLEFKTVDINLVQVYAPTAESSD